MSVLGSRPVLSVPRRVSGLRSHQFAFLLLALTAILVPQVAGAGQLLLSWVDNSAGSAGFRIERMTGTNGTYGLLDLESPGITTYDDTTVVDGTTYCYRVQAYLADGALSGYSNAACGSTATGLTLTVNVSGMGQGTVNSSPTGISCGTDCSQTYQSGVQVTLSAIAASGSTFGGWSGGGCSGTAPCTLIGNTAISVGATFAAVPPPVPPSSYTLSVAKSGPGTVGSSPTGISCGTDCSESYVSGKAVTLTATPAKGARFLGWTGGCSGSATTCSIVLNAATSVSATFSKGQGQGKR